MTELSKSLPPCLTAAFVLLAHAVPLSAAKPIVPFTEVTVDPEPPAKPYYKMLGDIDGDGDLDIVVGGAKGPLVWYRYPGWTKIMIAEGGWHGVRGAIGDVDRDGDADIVMGGVVWFSNPGESGGQWPMVRIDRQEAHDVELADLDGDDKLDVVARDQSAFGGTGNTIYIYRQNSPDSWSRHELPCPHGEGLALADLDADGDVDIIAGAKWYENIGTLGDWDEHTCAPTWTEPDAKVAVADFNGDGRLDVILTPAELKGQWYRVVWYEAPADPTDENWTGHQMGRGVECVIHSLGVADFDGDGDPDVAIAEMHQGEDPDEVTVIFNYGRGARWRRQILSTEGSHDIMVGDLEGDGDADIIGANHSGASHPLKLWRNDRLRP